jgi:hypothetical protein
LSWCFSIAFSFYDEINGPNDYSSDGGDDDDDNNKNNNDHRDTLVRPDS